MNWINWRGVLVKSNVFGACKDENFKSDMNYNIHAWTPYFMGTHMCSGSIDQLSRINKQITILIFRLFNERVMVSCACILPADECIVQHATNQSCNRSSMIFPFRGLPFLMFVHIGQLFDISFGDLWLASSWCVQMYHLPLPFDRCAYSLDIGVLTTEPQICHTCCCTAPVLVIYYFVLFKWPQ